MEYKISSYGMFNLLRGFYLTVSPNVSSFIIQGPLTVKENTWHGTILETVHGLRVQRFRVHVQSDPLIREHFDLPRSVPRHGGLSFRMCIIMLDASVLPFEISSRHTSGGIAYEQGQRKKGNFKYVWIDPSESIWKIIWSEPL